MATRRLLNIINSSTQNLPANKKFLNDLMRGVERYNMQTSRKGSRYYKPSGLKCMRQMYFVRMGAEQDTTPSEYNSLNMADTGTRRHEGIQEVLLAMKDMGYDWKYLDVAEYVKEKQKFGKCLSLEIKGTQGAETHLIDKALNTSFRCDGIIRRISTNEDYLFEFKNVISFKFAQVDNEPLAEHMKQVTCYCTSLDLDKAFVLYENRDNCELECPIIEITRDMKNNLVSYIQECEGYVERMIAPPKCEEKKTCRWCSYKQICQKVGD